MQSSQRKTNSTRDEPSTTVSADGDRQFYSRWYHQKQSSAKAHKNHGHEISLAKRPQYEQEQFKLFWQVGTLNYTNYWTNIIPLHSMEHAA